MESDKPLVTISMITYNQEQYVRDAVRGLLSQTYEPLEIIISDDHSSDRTWDIITEEVEKYRQTNGFHRNIILNRNVENLGIVKHCNLVDTLRHGSFVVGCGGDDISLPERVSKIVGEWNRTGRRATVIHHGYIEIDKNGGVIGARPPRSARIALGATAAYAKFIFDQFPPLRGGLSCEDQVWAKRALLYGDELRINDPLVKYRTGCGVSTKFKTFREQQEKDAIGMIESCEQLLVDLNNKQNVVDPKRFDFVKKMVDELLYISKLRYEMVMGTSIIQRYKAIRKLDLIGEIPAKTFMHRYYWGYVYTFPQAIADFQVRVLNRFR